MANLETKAKTCVCPEPISARIIHWDGKNSSHECVTCGRVYTRQATEEDYQRFFDKLLPPTLDP